MKQKKSQSIKFWLPTFLNFRIPSHAWLALARNIAELNLAEVITIPQPLIIS